MNWIFLGLIGIASVPLQTQAQVINKCIDGAGRVSYQDIPCPKGVRAIEIEPPPGPTEEQVASARDVAARDAIAAAQIREYVPPVYSEPVLHERVVPIAAQTAVPPIYDPYYVPAESYSYAPVYRSAYHPHADRIRHHFGSPRPHPEPRALHVGSPQPTHTGRDLRPR